MKYFPFLPKMSRSESKKKTTPATVTQAFVMFLIQINRKPYTLPELLIPPSEESDDEDDESDSFGFGVATTVL